MGYVVLARKYRPQVLDDVVGQEHIITILKNAIREDRIAQSFLFVGSRGIGKTSTARILAKILNCEKRAAQDVDPCNACPSCKEITDGSSFDVLEIDGASNRGIDEIRNLRENVKFKPAGGAFKVYIIDEVHMLTQEAFNALLKTLEEPPSHVKFIFATTEPHRVLPTIISRCQRYDFRRIPTKEIAASLNTIAEKEKIRIDKKALFAVAKAAEGGMRDAQSILDQVANYSKGEISLSDTEAVLGLTKEKTYIELIEYIAAKKTPAALTLIQNVISEGKDLRDFNKGLLELFRDMMVIKSVPHPEKLVDRLDETVDILRGCAETFGLEDILYCLTILQKLVAELRYSTFPQINTEVAVLKMTNRADMVAISDILEHLDSLSEEQSEDKKSSAAAPRSRLKKNPRERIEKRVNSYIAQHTAKKDDPAETPSADRHCSFQEIEEKWQTILSIVKKERMSTGTFLSEAEPIDVEGNRIIIALASEFQFHKEALETTDNVSLVEKTVRDVTAAKMKVTYVVTEKDGTESVIEEK